MFNKTLFVCFLILNLNQLINSSIIQSLTPIKDSESTFNIFNDKNDNLNKLVINDSRIEFLAASSADDYISFAETKSLEFSKSKDALESNSKQLICEDNDDKDVRCLRYAADLAVCKNLNFKLNSQPEWECKIKSAKIINKNVKIDENEFKIQCKKSPELNSQYYLPSSCVLRYKLSKLDGFNKKDDTKQKKGGLSTGWIVFIVFAVLLVASGGVFFVFGQTIVNSTCPNSSTGNKLAGMTMSTSTGGTSYR